MEPVLDEIEVDARGVEMSPAAVPGAPCSNGSRLTKYLECPRGVYGDVGSQASRARKIGRSGSSPLLPAGCSSTMMMPMT